MEVIIKQDVDAVSKEAARFFESQMESKPRNVFGLAAGEVLIPLFRELVIMDEAELLDFSQVSTFNLDEYEGLGPEHPGSARTFLKKHLFAHIGIAPEDTYAPDGMARDMQGHCEHYENAIRHAGGIDLQLLCIGEDGQIGFNEPSSSLSSRTRIKSLAPQDIAEKARVFGSEDAVPRRVITMGLGTVMDARQIVVVATGEALAHAVAAMVEGPLTADVPASILQMHPRCALILDTAAASQLRRADYYRWVYEQKPEWQRI